MTISHEALWNKAKTFAERGLEHRDAGRFDEFQLWAILALELLGKAALAHIHPALVADPQDFDALLNAVGHQKTDDYKSIPAKATFSRCRRVVDGFDEVAERFCNQMAMRRNAELHSGALPFAGMVVDAWQPRFWHCCKLLVTAQGKQLQDLVGPVEATSAEQIIADASRALSVAVKGRIERCKREFFQRFAKEVREQIAQSSRLETTSYRSEREEPTPCPACGCQGVLTGERDSERRLEPDQIDDDGEAWMWWYEVTYAAYGFDCRACGLSLDGYEELEAAELDTSFFRHEQKEAEWGDEYGND